MKKLAVLLVLSLFLAAGLTACPGGGDSSSSSAPAADSEGTAAPVEGGRPGRERRGPPSQRQQ
jgi:hypothetical protein